jgi:hypothetical protein
LRGPAGTNADANSESNTFDYSYPYVDTYAYPV